MDEEAVPSSLEIVERVDPATLFQNKYVSEETLKRIASHRGIVGTILTDSLGIPIKSSMDHATTMQYARYVGLIVMKSKNLTRDLEPTDTMTLVRVRTKMHELVVVPSEDYYIIIVQRVVVVDQQR